MEYSGAFLTGLATAVTLALAAPVAIAAPTTVSLSVDTQDNADELVLPAYPPPQTRITAPLNAPVIATLNEVAQPADFSFSFFATGFAGSTELGFGCFSLTTEPTNSPCSVPYPPGTDIVVGDYSGSLWLQSDPVLGEFELSGTFDSAAYGPLTGEISILIADSPGEPLGIVGSLVDPPPDPVPEPSSLDDAIGFALLVLLRWAMPRSNGGI